MTTVPAVVARVPALFVSHGAPTVALDDNDYTAALRRVGALAPSPDAVVAVSAHWQGGPPIRVTAAARPRQIFDFGGFPEALYAVRYAPPGAPDLAAGIVATLRGAGFAAEADEARGLDHGVWVPLRFIHPSAAVPVVQVTLPASFPPGELLRLGGALAPLRERNILLMGSGGIVHNLRRVRLDRPDAPVEAWAREFDLWVAARLRAFDVEGLARYAEAPHAADAVPTSEHFDPLFVVLGSAVEGERVVTLFEGFQHGTLSLRSVLVTARE